MSLMKPHIRVGAVMIAALMGTAIVSPLYPIYQEAWGLTTSEVSQLYVIYMLGALFSLLVLGRLADKLGWRQVLITALVLNFIGTFISMLTNDYLTFVVARFIIGIGGSLATTAGTVTLMRVVPKENHAQLATISSVIITAGFGIGPVIGGLFGHFVHNPLVLVHVPTLVFLALSLALVIFTLPDPEPQASQLRLGDLIPKMSWTKGEAVVPFAITCSQAFVSFGVFALYASLAPLMLRDILGFGGALIGGIYIGGFMLGVAAVQILARHYSRRKMGLLGIAMMGCGNLIMLANLSLKSAAVFAIGVLIAALAHGFSVLSSSAAVNAMSDRSNRGALTASYWVTGYCGSILPLMAAGWIADRWGMQFATSAFCIFMSIICALIFVAMWRFAVPKARQG